MSQPPSWKMHFYRGIGLSIFAAESRPLECEKANRVYFQNFSARWAFGSLSLTKVVKQSCRGKLSFRDTFLEN